MQKIDTTILKFLLDYNVQLIRPPLSGQLKDIFLIYEKELDSNYTLASDGNCSHDHLTFETFVGIIHEINRLTNNAITLTDPLLVQYDKNESVVSHIDTFSLKILCDMLTNTSREKQKQKQKQKHKEKHKEKTTDYGPTSISLTDNLLKLLNGNENCIDPETHCDEAHDMLLFEVPLKKNLYSRLERILKEEPISYLLNKERARHSVEKIKYFPICHNREHSHLLSQCVYISNNKIVSIQWSKLNKFSKVSQQSKHHIFLQCIQTHIHYIPNLKPQTDLSLGDCSYLDTCHKLNSCRYLHYLQYIPETLNESIEKQSKIYNSREINNLMFYTHGLCCAYSNKLLLPPQWIRCDVRNFDFTILGKFSAVIADPAWNIHMNLPYGTCNDIELLELPLGELQIEGILFLWVTGRAIELGKESLSKWGYEVINEVSWIKTNQLGRTIVTGRTGHWLNHSKEHLLVGVKGDPQWLNKHIDIDLIVSTTRETSRKPDELYGIIERLVGQHARKLEIFGRDHNIRPGWFTVGNQLTGTCIHEMDVRKKYEKWVESTTAAATIS